MYRISNDYLSVGVLRTGAELCSIKSQQNEKEYIWQANPEVWRGHAPNLFPIIGLLKEGHYFFEGQKYKLPKHGFVRHNPDIQLEKKTQDTLIFCLKYSEETLKQYPFKFEFRITYKLREEKLEVNHEVLNLDKKSMFFSLGGHPAFNVPLYEAEKYEDYVLEFDQDQNLKTHLISKKGLVTGETEQVLQNEREIQLHKNLFDRDALVFKNIPSKKVTLKSKNHGKILSVSYEDFENLGIWAKPAAPFVCIEPWLGIADSEDSHQNLKTKEGIIELMPSDKYHARYTIKIG